MSKSKLQELIEAVKTEHGSAFENCRECTYGTHNEEVIVKLNRLAELEDKLESGLLLELPCKVGDTVFRAWYAPCRYGETYPDSYGCSGCEGGCDIKPTVFEETASSLAYILENMVLDRNYVYATREEAEQKLKEL